MKKLLKTMALLLAAATMLTVVPSKTAAATRSGAIAKRVKVVKITEGQELGEAITIAASQGTNDGQNVQSTGSYEIRGNDYTYVGVLEDAKKRQTFIRIPYWFSDAFPNTKWYIKKNKIQVKITVKPKAGLGGKKFTKSVTLSRDSRYWLGGFNDFNNDEIIPPWIQRIFKEEAPTIAAGNDPDLGACQVMVLRTWKDKTAKRKNKNPIVKVIHYVNYNHYRVTTTNRYNGEGGGGGGTIIID